MTFKRNQKHAPQDADLINTPINVPIGSQKGGRGVSGKGLSDSQSSSKGRKSTTAHKKLEEDAK
jgi:hypothetical protein